MITTTSIADILAAPLGEGWTVDQLAEEVLGTVAAQGSEAPRELILDADSLEDRQSRRLVRPLLARLATLSAAEAGTPPNLYGGQLAFRRSGPDGTVWILGEFENSQARAWAALRRSSLPPT